MRSGYFASLFKLNILIFNIINSLLQADQLALIMEINGHPPPHLITNATRRRLFFDSNLQPRCIKNSKGRVRRPGSRDLANVIFKNNNGAAPVDIHFVNFLKKCFTWDAKERLEPEQGLKDPWVLGATTSTVSIISSK